MYGSYFSTTSRCVVSGKRIQWRKCKSVIFTHNDEQQKIAKGVIEELQTAFDKPIVTEMKPFEIFYKA